MEYNLNNRKPGINPTWQIHYVGATIKNPDHNNYPEAHTHGLNEYNHGELQIRFVDFKTAAYILNTIGTWVITEKIKLAPGDKIVIGNIEHNIASAFDSSGILPVLRLCWSNDLNNTN